MWEIYDALIEQIDEKLTVRHAMYGGCRAMVRSSAGGCGLASLLLQGAAPAAVCPRLGAYIGRPLRDVAALVKSWDNLESAIGMAAINSFYNEAAAVRSHGAQVFGGGKHDGDAFQLLLPFARGRQVATIGHFQQVRELYQDVCRLTIFERAPREGDLPDAAAEYLLPEMELVFITGMTLTNKTLPRLLQLAANAKVVLIGPSAPLTPLLGEFGVDMLSGLLVRDAEACERAICGTDFTGIFDSGHKVIIDLNERVGDSNEAVI